MMDSYDEFTMPIREVARWIAKMAAQDGVITANERKLLKEFADTYGIHPPSLYRMAYAIAINVEVPEVQLISSSQWKGLKFEEFIVSLYADIPQFTLLAWRGDKSSGAIYPLDSLMPDLHIRHTIEDKGEVRYFVECKFRMEMPEEGLDICKQLNRYRRIASKIGRVRLFIALGLGGHPSCPDELYLIPAEYIKTDGIIRISECQQFLCKNTSGDFYRQIVKCF